MARICASRSIIRANGDDGSNGVRDRSCPSTSQPASGPRAATGWVGWRLRSVPGIRRNASETSPEVDGVRRASNTGCVSR